MKFQDFIKLRKQYDRLPIEERLRRAEFLANYYLSLVSHDANFVVDATKHWPQYGEMARQAPAIEAGATTMAEVFFAQ
ncbi:hypothetical protein D3C80_1430050 [compost metagenome]